MAKSIDHMEIFGIIIIGVPIGQLIVLIAEARHEEGKICQEVLRNWF